MKDCLPFPPEVAIYVNALISFNINVKLKDCLPFPPELEVAIYVNALISFNINVKFVTIYAFFLNLV